MQKALFFVFFSILFSANAQTRWYNPLDVEFPVIHNQGWTDEIGKSFTRLPDRAKQDVREPVWNLSRNSAGLAIHFYTNASEITIRYQVNGSLSMHHMPATGVSGIDLYQINSDGEWNICAEGFSFRDTIHYSFKHIEKSNYHNNGYEYRLYLPLYNSVKWLEIGVAEGCEFSFIPLSPEKPIVIYGTSIAQGGCASRPAMTWGSILQRKLDSPVINLGFSGNGRLEKEVLNYITEINARLFILDCLPNLAEFEEEDTSTRTYNAVKQIREKHSCPILLVEHIGYSNASTNTKRHEDQERANRASRKAYEQLLSEGVQGIYYITRQELDIPADGWVDHIHLTDLGMLCQATAIEKKIRDILQIPMGNIRTTIPVTQRREPYKYEWMKRHYEILSIIKEEAPRSVIIGNSITHFWGGKPLDTPKSGTDSWNKHMPIAGFQNLGYGWDRIENVLWRIYHGELDGYKTEKVVLMIGTNNLGLNTDEEIIEGLRFLLSAINKRQPQAEIRVIGILPRREQEEWVYKINLRIQEMSIQEGYTYRNPGKNLLKPNGKIDESLFSDGLHPNEIGYQLIVKEMIE